MPLYSACGASLDLLPNAVLLYIMSLVDVKTVVLLSRVCKRFYQLHSDGSIWRNVPESVFGGYYHLNSHVLKKVISNLLCLSTRKVTLSSRWRNKFIVTTAVLDELFTKCPQLKETILHGCDLSLVSVWNQLSLHN